MDNLTAISGDKPRFPFTSSDNVVRVTPRAAAFVMLQYELAKQEGAGPVLPDTNFLYLADFDIITKAVQPDATSAYFGYCPCQGVRSKK